MLAALLFTACGDAGPLTKPACICRAWSCLESWRPTSCCVEVACVIECTAEDWAAIQTRLACARK